MSQKDGFAGGFLVGALFGSLLGGVVGAIVANRSSTKPSADKTLVEANSVLPLGTEEEMEVARRNLESKIAQLNSAIDEVRQQLDPLPTSHHSLKD